MAQTPKPLSPSLALAKVWTSNKYIILAKLEQWLDREQTGHENEGIGEESIHSVKKSSETHK